MAAKCEFTAAQLNERIRDQFVAWCSSPKVRERLLQEPLTRTLDEIVQIALTVERASAEAPALTSSSTPTDQAVHRIDRKQSPPTSKGGNWDNGGRTGSAVKSDKGSARNKTCDYCGKRGHFSASCYKRLAAEQPRDNKHSYHRRRRSQTPQRRYGGRTAAANQVDSDNDQLVDEFDDPVVDHMNTITINSVHAQRGTFKHVSCKIAGIPITLLLDLGAKVSIVTQAFYEKHLFNVKVENQL
jgi:hypothetical protein